MYFNFFNFNLDLSITRPFIYEVLVYPSDINGEVDYDQYSVYYGSSRIKAYYYGWKKARIEAEITGKNHDFTISYGFAETAKAHRRRDWEFLVSRTIEVKIQVSFFSR